jgi:hypothetical protein
MERRPIIAGREVAVKGETRVESLDSDPTGFPDRKVRFEAGAGR